MPISEFEAVGTCGAIVYILAVVAAIGTDFTLISVAIEEVFDFAGISGVSALIVVRVVYETILAICTFVGTIACYAAIHARIAPVLFSVIPEGAIARPVVWSRSIVVVTMVAAMAVVASVTSVT